jgi:hypothetical protein
MRTIAAAAALILCAGAAHGMTKWNGEYTSVTSATITYATHGIASGMIGVICVPTGGTRLDLDQVSWTVDQSTYEVDITFSASFTGTVYLSGPWPSSDTSNSTDFEVTIGASNDQRLNVCAQCGTYTARRTYNSQTNTADSVVSLITDTGWAATTVYVYIDENMLTFGLNSSGCELGSYSQVGTSNVVCGVNSMPSGTGIIPLATAAVSSGVFTTVTDQRPW